MDLNEKLFNHNTTLIKTAAQRVIEVGYKRASADIAAAAVRLLAAAQVELDDKDAEIACLKDNIAKIPSADEWMNKFYALRDRLGMTEYRRLMGQSLDTPPGMRNKPYTSPAVTLEYGFTWNAKEQPAQPLPCSPSPAS